MQFKQVVVVSFQFGSTSFVCCVGYRHAVTASWVCEPSRHKQRMNISLKREKKKRKKMPIPHTTNFATITYVQPRQIGRAHV